MPISGIVLSCLPDRLDAICEAISSRSMATVRDCVDNMLVVITDTNTLDEDRAEVEGLLQIDGVVASHVVFSNIEDALEVSQ